MAVALIVGGAAIMAPQAGPAAHLFRWVGYGLLVVGCVVFVASMFLLHRMRPWRAHRDGQDPDGTGIEDWRTVVGNRLRRAPFVPGCADWVLTQHGNRVDDPLGRLRSMQADVDRWV